MFLGTFKLFCFIESITGSRTDKYIDTLFDVVKIKGLKKCNKCAKLNSFYSVSLRLALLISLSIKSPVNFNIFSNFH